MNISSRDYNEDDIQGFKSFKRIVEQNDPELWEPDEDEEDGERVREFDEDEDWLGESDEQK